MCPLHWCMHQCYRQLSGLFRFINAGAIVQLARYLIHKSWLRLLWIFCIPAALESETNSTDKILHYFLFEGVAALQANRIVFCGILVTPFFSFLGFWFCTKRSKVVLCPKIASYIQCWNLVGKNCLFSENHTHFSKLLPSVMPYSWKPLIHLISANHSLSIILYICLLFLWFVYCLFLCIALNIPLHLSSGLAVNATVHMGDILVNKYSQELLYSAVFWCKNIYFVYMLFRIHSLGHHLDIKILHLGK